MEYSNALSQGGYQNSANWSRCGKPWHVSERRLAAVIETRGTTRYQEKFAIKYIMTTGATTTTTIIYDLKSWIIFIVYSVPGFSFLQPFWRNIMPNLLKRQNVSENHNSTWRHHQWAYTMMIATIELSHTYLEKVQWVLHVLHAWHVCFSFSLQSSVKWQYQFKRKKFEFQ